MTADSAARRGGEVARQRALHDLQAAAAAAGSQADVARLACLTVDYARDLLAFEGANLYCWDAEAELLYSLAHNDPHIPQPTPVMRAGQGVTGRAFSERAPVVITDYPAWDHVTTWGRRLRPCCVVAVPLLANEQALGVLVAQSYTPREIAPEQVRLLERLAARVAPAIEAMRLYAAAERRRVEAETLAEMVCRGAAEAETERVIDLITTHTGLLLGADYAAVALCDAAGVTTWHGVWGNRSEAWRAAQRPAEMGNAGAAPARGEIVAIEYLGENTAPAWERFPIHHSEGGRTALSIALRGHERAFGALIVGWRTEVRLSAPQRRLAETLAGYATTMIEIASARASAAARAAALAASEERLRIVYDTMVCGVLVLGATGEIIDANDVAQEVFGATLERLRGQRPTEARMKALREDGTPLPPQEHPVMVALRTGQPQRDVVLGIVPPDGHYRWIRVDVLPIVATDGTPQTVVSFIDITARKQAEQALRESEERYRQMFETNQAVKLLIDPESGRVVDANQAACDFYGYSKPALTSMDISAINMLSDAEVREEMARAARQNRLYFVFRHRLAGGEVRTVEVYSGPVNLRGRTLLYSIVHDISERTQAEEALQYRALHDALTNLPNRTLLHDRLQQALLGVQRDQQPMAFLLLDLDRFKEVNDTYVHHHGDLLLQQVAARLRGVLRASDTVARLGGDEFAVLLPGDDHGGALLAAHKLLATLTEPFLVKRQALHIGASIGIALAPEHGRDAQTLLRQADVAMYVAKRTRSGYAVYAPEQDQHSPDRVAFHAALQAAIEQGTLMLHYQPIVNVANRQVRGVEVLARWSHPRQGPIPPDHFITLAEQTGSIGPLTRWVLDEALRQCAAWQQLGLSLTMSVNLSLWNLHDTDLPETITTLLQAHSVPATRLRLELTESTLMEDVTRTREMLQRLAAVGVGIAVDNYGIGSSSLAHLKRLPVDEIKIDKSFMRHVAHDETEMTIVSSIIGLGHNLGLHVVAEGVETHEAWERLARLGCDAAQGYVLSPPRPAADLAGWLHSAAGTGD